MSKQDYPYPADEFDTLGADRTPQGVHRAPLSRLRQWLPFLLVLILAPTLAFVVVRALSGAPESDPTANPTTAVTSAPPSETPEPTETASAEPSDEPSEEPTTEEPTADLDFDLSVYVLNGSGVSGLASDVADDLGEAGWTDVVPDNYSREQPTETTLFYTDADMAEEAAAIAETLGITALVESADAASNGVVIVLRSDFEA